MRAFIHEFRTTNELLFKEKNNSLSELRFEVQGLLRVINNTPISNHEVKGVTTRGGKTTTQDVQDNNTNIYTEEPLVINHYKLVIQPQRRLNPKVQDVVKNEIVKLLDSGLIYPISDSSWVSPIYVVPKKGGMIVVLNDNNDLILSRTVTGWRVCIDYHRMLARCKETKLVLNWEKCHFVVKEGIVLGHKISRAGIEVDRAKIDVIAKLSYPTNVKGVRSFLGHAGFYQRFIKDFSMISKPMTQLLMKDAKFDFFDDCKKAFDILKQRLTVAPIIISPD
ncbi:hypothetical protein Tco_0400759 [Tanacetum coccineum]